MNLYFVRHGQKKEDYDDSDLTNNGEEQSKKLGKFIKKIKFHEFYCSDLNRAKQTASIVSKYIKLEPKVKSVLNEYEMDMLKKEYSIWTKEEKKRYNELIQFLDKIAKDKVKDKEILIISHGVTNRLILAYFLKINLKLVVPFMQTETGVNLISWNDKHKNWRLINWNNESHLL